MCLAIPGRVVRVWEDGAAARMAEIDFDGVVKTANLVFTPEVAVGDYVIVHAGLATTRIPEAEALEAQRTAREMRERGEAEESARVADLSSPRVNLPSPED